MRVWVQWALATPTDWFAVDITRLNAIRNLPRKAAPGPGAVIDDAPGWLAGLNCQGIDFSGYDHTALELVGSGASAGLRITGWQDDPDDFPPDVRWATEWTLMPPAPDERLGGVVNTVQARRVWATPDAAAWFPGVPVLPWAEFVPPPSNLTFHGVWLPDALWAAHLAARTRHGWREWAP